MVEGDLDVPGVQGVLVEPEPDEALEADTYGTGREGETFAFFIAERFEGRRKRGVCGKGVVDLLTWRLGVPLLPDGGHEIIRDGGFEAALHDHRGGTEVRHHLSGRPLTGVGRLSDGGLGGARQCRGAVESTRRVRRDGWAVGRSWHSLGSRSTRAGSHKR